MHVTLKNRELRFGYSFHKKICRDFARVVRQSPHVALLIARGKIIPHKYFFFFSNTARNNWLQRN